MASEHIDILNKKNDASSIHIDNDIQDQHTPTGYSIYTYILLWFEWAFHEHTSFHDQWLEQHQVPSQLQRKRIKSRMIWNEKVLTFLQKRTFIIFSQSEHASW